MTANLFIALLLACDAEKCVSATSDMLFTSEAACVKSLAAVRAQLPPGLKVAGRCVYIDKLVPNGVES